MGHVSVKVQIIQLGEARNHVTSYEVGHDVLWKRLESNFEYRDGPVPVVSTYNSIYRMYNPIYNHL